MYHNELIEFVNWCCNVHPIATMVLVAIWALKGEGIINR